METQLVIRHHKSSVFDEIYQAHALREKNWRRGIHRYLTGIRLLIDAPTQWYTTHEDVTAEQADTTILNRHYILLLELRETGQAEHESKMGNGTEY